MELDNEENLVCQKQFCIVDIIQVWWWPVAKKQRANVLLPQAGEKNHEIQHPSTPHHDLPIYLYIFKYLPHIRDKNTRVPH